MSSEPVQRRVAFRDESAFVPSGSYRMLPFRFAAFGESKRLVVNEVGEHEVITEDTFRAFVTGTMSSSSEEYLRLKSKHFLSDSRSRVPYELLATKYRTKRQFLEGFTKLHIFVVSLRCEHSCHYCQVSRVSANRRAYDMSESTAEKALDLVFRSPAASVKIEFQGGEPLLNFELIAQVVEAAEARAVASGKAVEFVVTSNLALVTDEMLVFFRDHRVSVSTSLDGPAFIHDANRPRPGANSYQTAVDGIRRVRAALGHEAVAAIMTATRLSLDHAPAIVDEYVNLGFDSIFLRSLSPYGFAARKMAHIGYSVEQFLEFYVRALDRIIEVNRAGYFLVESYAQILLAKMLTPFSPGYVDLQSPTGAGIGAVVYNYDGDVYPSDEARMLAEMEDKTLRLGNVHENSYDEIFGGTLLRALVQASLVESTPLCADCAFQTFCGSDPTFNYATQGDFVGHRPTSEFHRKNEFIIRHLLSRYYDDPSIRPIFWSWVQHTPAACLLRRGEA